MIDGKQVVDADKPVVIHITEVDCERGSKKDPTKCAAALALKRVTSCDESRVHIACTYLRFGNKWLRYATPPSLKAEIISFDRGGGFYPGDFRLHPMAAANRLKPVNRKPGPRPKDNLDTFVAEKKPAVARAQGEPRAGSSSSDEVTPELRQERTGEKETIKNGRQDMPKIAKKLKAERRVFHRVQGVREHAGKS
jgi:hypothetical protein